MHVLTVTLLLITSVATAEVCPDGRKSSDFIQGSLQFVRCQNIQNAYFEKDLLKGADASGSHFYKVGFNKVNFDNVQMTSVEFRENTFEKVTGLNWNIQNSRWMGGIIKDSHLSKNRLDASKLGGVKIYRTNLSETSLKDTTWSNCYFEDVNLEGADLRGARFDMCVFLNVRMKGAIFNKYTKLPISDAQRSLQGMVYSP